MQTKRTLLIFLLTLIAFSFIVEATLYIEDIQCSEKGDLNILAEYTCSANKCPKRHKKLLSEINITAISGEENIRIEFENSSILLEEDKTYSLLSKPEILSNYKRYSLIIDDNESKIILQDKPDSKEGFSCPNVDYLCGTINLEIDLCMKEKLYFYYLFHGLEDQFSEKELKEDIQYYVNPSNTYIGSTLLRSDDLKSTVFQSEKLPQDYEVSSIGQDRYVLKVPYSDLKNKNMEYIYINVNDCNSMIYNTNNIMECSDRECYENEDCPIGSYCDKNTCKIRLCDNCQIINDHECISKCEARNACETANCQENICTYTKKEACCLIDSDCNDKLSCTEDSCINQKCSNQEVTCEGSKDECTIGKCEEEQGCIYYTKDECTDFSSITGNAINDIIMSRPGIITARIIIISIIVFIGFKLLNKKKVKKKRKKRKKK